MRTGLFGLLFCVVSPVAGQAQDVRSATTGVPSPAASIDSLGWLAGSWSAPGLVGPATETYSAIIGGRITGHFVQDDGKGGIAFSELVEYVPLGNSLAYRVRHFNSDMSGWEDKTGKPIVFPLVVVEGERWYFDGMTIDRTGADAFTMWVRIGEDGESRDMPFRFTRIR